MVGLPLARARSGAGGEEASEGGAEVAGARREDLERRKEQKLAEIREAELDRRTGKLSASDYEQVDGALRAEAVELMRELDQEREGDGNAPREPAG